MNSPAWFRRVPVVHPLFAALGTAWVTQIAGLFFFCLGHDPAGHPLVTSPLNTLMIAVPLYTAWWLVLAGSLVALWWLAGALRHGVTAIAVAVSAGLMLMSEIDLGMQRFRGERLSAAHLQAYGTTSLFNSDWIAPVIQDPWYPIVTLGLVAAGWLVITLLLIRARRAAVGSPGGRAALGCLTAGGLCFLLVQFAYYHQRDMAQPPYVLLARSWIYPTRPMTPERERQHREDLRRYLDPAGSSRWLSDEQPLMRTLEPARPVAVAGDLPDIVVFVVESLRGCDVGYGTNPRPPGKSPTPNLDALARRGIVFSHYIANGDPSPRGFICLHTGLWEHKWGFIIANFPNLHVDSIPVRLRARGYRTMALWGGNPSFDNQLTWARRWYDEVDFSVPGNGVFYFRTTPDSLLMDKFIARVREHDRRSAGRPFFAYVASNGTHTPFIPEGPGPFPPGPQARYELCLRAIDAEIARVVKFLDARPRGANTIVVVVGDHSDKTDEAIDEPLRGLPLDPLEWTTALFRGPERLLGRPRREDFHASHVDLLPTVLRWIGDRGAVATVGHDLFAPIPAAQRQAVAVNSRGYRWDRGGYSLLVDATDPRQFAVFRSFAGGRPVPVPLADSPFGAGDPVRLTEWMVYWSYLVEQDRVWRSAPAEDRP